MVGKTLIGGTLVMLAILMSGCGQQVSVGEKAVQHIDISRVKTYTSVAAVVRDSSLIASVAVVSQESKTLGGIPFTVSTVSVNRVLRGTAPGASLRVDQVGANSAVAGPLMTDGGRYLVFLTPAPDGNYYVVGVAAGLYQDSGTSYVRMDIESPALPVSLSHSEMETQVQAGP